MDATAATPATAPNSIATTQNLPAPVVQALTERTANDPALHSLVDRILNGTATLADSFRYLLLVNQVTIEEFHKTQRQQSTAMQRGRKPRTRCRN